MCVKARIISIMVRNTQYSQAHLEENLMIVALAIKYHGDAYWPLYHLIEDELEKLKSHALKLENSMAIHAEKRLALEVAN